MNPPLDTELLRTFVTIVETESFTRSGDQLHRTQPAISMQMKRLEDALGKPLFDRTRRGVRLTKEGDILLHYARRILALSAEARNRIDQSDLHGVVRLGTSDDYANILLPEILRRFSASHPNVRIDLVCDNGVAIEQKLHDGAIDLALVCRRGDVAREELIRTEELVWIGAEQREPTMRPIPLAVFPEGCACREAMADALDRLKLSWRVAFSSDNISAIHAAVRSGLAITAVERGLIPDGVRLLGQADGLPELERVKLALKIGPAASPDIGALAADIRNGLAIPAAARRDQSVQARTGYAEATGSAGLA